MKSQYRGWFLVGALIWVSPALADIPSPFAGEIDFSKKKFQINVKAGEESTVTVELTLLAENQFRLQADIQNLKTPLFDISTQLESAVEQIPEAQGQGRFFKGVIGSRYSLINHKPVQELGGQYEIKGKKIILSSLSLDGLTCDGTIDLQAPLRIDLALQLKDIAMSDFLLFFIEPGEEIYSAGFVSGQIHMSGPLNELMVKGHLTTYDGYVKELDYHNILVNFEGMFPLILLRNSSVTLADGHSFNLEGPIDLGQKDRFREQIVALEKLPMVSEDLEKMEWTIKRITTADDSRATEIKYLRRLDKDIGQPAKETSDMFGIERSMKF